MIKEFIGTGKTVEEATAAAKAGLNAPALANINVEVIAMPKKKVLGLFGGHDAEVKVWYDDGRKERKPRPKKDMPLKEASRKPERKPQPKKEVYKTAEAPKAVYNDKKAEEAVSEKDIDINAAVNYLKAMLKGLLIEDAEINAKLEDGVLVMEVQCEDYGIIIGRRGETLDSLQYLTSLAVKKSCDKYVRVILNVGNYREKRAETLRNLARKNANYVLRTGRRYTFEPMNPYERRIIHTTIQEVEGVDSMSVGYGQDRKVVLQPVDGVRPNRPSGPARRSTPPAAAPRNTAPKADRADLPRFGKIEVNKD